MKHLYVRPHTCTFFRRVRKIVTCDYHLQRVFVFFHLSACIGLTQAGRIFMKINIWGFFENLLRKFKFHGNLTRITGTLHEDRYTFCIIYRSFLLGMRNASDKFVEKIKIHILCSITFFFKKNRAIYEICWKILHSRLATLDNIIRRMLGN